MKKLTVLQTLPALHSGGVERGTLEIARALVAAGHRSIVVSNGGRLVDQLVREGSEHIQMPVHRKSLASLFQIRPFRRLLRELKPDIVHARSRIPAWIAWLALRRMHPSTRPRFITTVHGLYSVSPYSAIMTKGDAVIAVSQTVFDYIQLHYPSCSAKRIHLIYRGVDSLEFPYDYRPSAAWLMQWRNDFPELEGKTILALPGRITRLKGHETFLKLLTALLSVNPKIHGLIVGGAEIQKKTYLNELYAQVSNLNLTKHVTFTGHRSDMRDVLSQCRIIYALSTKPETFGRAVLEALRLGKPVLGWNVGGVGEVLAKAYPQGAVERNNVIALLNQTVECLSQHPLPPPTNDFQLKDMCEKTIELYENVVKSTNPILLL